MYATVNWLNKRPLRLTAATTSVTAQGTTTRTSYGLYMCKQEQQNHHKNNNNNSKSNYCQATHSELLQQPQRIVAIARKCVYFYARMCVCVQSGGRWKKINGENWSKSGTTNKTNNKRQWNTWLRQNALNAHAAVHKPIRTYRMYIGIYIYNNNKNVGNKNANWIAGAFTKWKWIKLQQNARRITKQQQ